MPASTYVGNQILNCFLRAVPPTLPTDLFIGLHTGDPGPTGINEVTLAAWPLYGRKDASLAGALAAAFTTAADKISFNTQRLEYGVMNGAAVLTITHFAIWDAPTGGNLYIYGPLTEQKALAPTDECLINPNKLQTTVI